MFAGGHTAAVDEAKTSIEFPFQKVEYFIPLKEKEKRRQRNDNPYPNYPSAENLLLSEQCCYFCGTNPQIADPHQANGKPKRRTTDPACLMLQTSRGAKVAVHVAKQWRTYLTFFLIFPRDKGIDKVSTRPRQRQRTFSFVPRKLFPRSLRIVPLSTKISMFQYRQLLRHISTSRSRHDLSLHT